MPTSSSSVERIAIPLAEAARLLGVHPMTLRRVIYRGELPVIRLGRKLLIPRAAFAQLAEGARAAVAPGDEQ
jgi:excisionase family DNA binding protein